jgi:hypothetical protein
MLSAALGLTQSESKAPYLTFELLKCEVEPRLKSETGNDL